MIRRAALLATAAVLFSGCSGSSETRPVGRYLVFTKAIGLPQQAIWIGDVDGRRMRRLARGDYGLVAPDGRLIALSRRSDLHTIEPSGEGERGVARGRPVGWFPDSRHLLAIRRNDLVSIDIRSGVATILVRQSKQLRGWSLAPTGAHLAYALAAKESPWGLCREDLDIYVVDGDGKARRRLTANGRSSDPVWGDGWIAFARHPAVLSCLAPSAGVWKMRPDGSQVQPIVRKAPRRFAWDGYYGLRPHAWAQGRPLIVAGVRSEWGDELALVDTRTARIRRPDLDPRPRYSARMYVDRVSGDGRFVVGAACGAEFPCTIQIFSVLSGKSHNVATGHVGSPDWNR